MLVFALGDRRELVMECVRVDVTARHGGDGAGASAATARDELGALRRGERNGHRVVCCEVDEARNDVQLLRREGQRLEGGSKHVGIDTQRRGGERVVAPLRAHDPELDDDAFSEEDALRRCRRLRCFVAQRGGRLIC